MAYDEGLAQRVRATLAEQPAVVEKKMFGGLTFMLQGNMCCGIIKDGLLVRVGPARYAAALDQPHAQPMMFTGKPMKGIVLVGAQGCATEPDLQHWVQQGVAFAGSLPPK